MRVPRVAYFIDELRLGGATRQLAVLGGAARGRMEPIVYCLSRHTEPLGTILRQAGVEVRAFERRLRWDPWFVAELKRQLGHDRVDLVHGWLQAAVVRKGHGRVTVLGDSQLLTMPWPGRPPEEFDPSKDNIQFTLNLFHWLTGRL